MTTAKGRFIALFLLGLSQYSATDIYLLLYLQHVNQRHLISEKAYNYALASPSYFYVLSSFLSLKKKKRLNNGSSEVGAVHMGLVPTKQTKKETACH